MGESKFTRFPWLCVYLFSVVSWSSSHGEYSSRSKYPLEIHQLYRDRLAKSPKVGRTEGVWSEWSNWSPCSRSCGGGITIQTRECISKPVNSRVSRTRRKSYETNEVENRCVGLYKRYHLCNAQPCPMDRDFRAEQCAVYNSSPFRGRIYFWEPYLKAGECVLNCRAVGMGFYAQLNKTVWDGTPCSSPITSSMQPAPAGTRGVCVTGVCKSVSTEGIIGAISPPRLPELCSECSGGCKSESLFFLKAILTPGYHPVGTIPKGACRISISQLKLTRNFIALRHPNGTYLLNGEGEVARRHEVHFAGTTFHYKRQDSVNVESISAKGPLQHSVDIMILYYQPNPGIKYEYMIPADQAVLPSVFDARRHVGMPSVDVKKPEPPVEAKKLDRPFVNMNQQNDDTRPSVHRRRRKKFVWKIVRMTPCSKSCGGGISYPVSECVREHTQTNVHERRCARLEKPNNYTLCNTHPCPKQDNKAYWGGSWSACSATCGPGEQTRVPICMQDGIPIHPGACSSTSPVTMRRCEIATCDPKDNELEQEPPTPAQWHTGGWSQCSVTCGSGQRTRSVTCSGQCRAQDRPSTTEACHGPPCPGSLTRPQHLPSSIKPTTGGSSPPSASAVIASSSWLVTEWSESCSEECGTGMQQRWVACPGGECTHSNKPDNTRACSSDKHCGGKWYAGPWGPCSESCAGQAKQKREVLCIVHIRGQIRVVSDMTCPHMEKPVSEQLCEGTCKPRWHTGEWNSCEGPCSGNTGIQRRDVRCLDYHGRHAVGCAGDVPPSKRTCTCTDYRFREIAHAQDEPSLDGDCVNTIPNCTIIIQGRMCRLPAYYKQCCASCRRAHQSPRE